MVCSWLCSSVDINNVVCSIHQPPAKPSLSTDNIHKHQPCSNTPHYQELHRVISRYCCGNLLPQNGSMHTRDADMCQESVHLCCIEKLPSPLQSSRAIVKQLLLLHKTSLLFLCGVGLGGSILVFICVETATLHQWPE